VVVAAALRRFRRLPGPARRLGAFALAAALLAALGDLVLVLLDTYLGSVLQDDDGRTALGGVVAVFDIGRFLWVPLVLGAGAWAARVSAGPRVRTIEVGEGDARLRLQDRVAAALHDDTVRVAFPAPGAAWVGTDGSPAELGAPGRSVTVVERDGEPVAAVEHAAALDDRPVVVEAAVAAAAATIEFERLEALARSRYIDAQEARHAIVDVEDTVRRRIERDLHDGAQQRLVGLALQASLAAVAAARGEGDDGTTAAALVLGIDEARADLHHLVAGLAPAVLAERGLASALATLAATTPMAVDVRVALPTDLPAAAATLAWFVVAESVANTVKHAGASRLEIEGAVADGALTVCVRDDGCGGADDAAGTGLRNLRRRVADAGGVLRVDSPVGGGTTVRVEIASATPGRTR
jgi:signal transduction histidine kinase